MMGRKSQHGAGDGEIIMLPPRAVIDDPILLLLNFEGAKLLKSTPAHRSFRQADLIGAKFPQQHLEQMCSADMVYEWHRC